MELPICKLKRVGLTNFKRHAELEVEFAEGLTTIVGPNYIGKTTVAQAIFFALFGVSAMPGDRDSLVRWGERSCSVVLEMTLGEKLVVVTRTLSTAKVTEDGVLVASGPSPVTEWCEQALGGNAKTVLRLSRSGRGEATGLIEEGATKLNKLIEEAHNLKYIDDLIQKSSERETYYRGIFGALTETDTKPIVERLEALELSLSNYQNTLSVSSDTLTKVSGDFERAKSDYDELRLSQIEGTKHAREVGDLRSQLNVSQGRLQTLQETLGTEVPEAVISLDVESAKAVWRTALRSEQDNEAVKAERARVEKWLADNTPKVEESVRLAALLKPAQEKLEVSAERVRDASAQANTLESTVQQLEASLKKAVCSSCRRPFDEEHAKVAEAELAQARKALEGTERNVAEARKIHDQNKAMVAELCSQTVDTFTLNRFRDYLEEVAKPLVLKEADAAAAEATYQAIQKKFDIFQGYQTVKAKVGQEKNAVAALAARLEAAESTAKTYATETAVSNASAAMHQAGLILEDTKRAKRDAQQGVESTERDLQAARTAIAKAEQENARKIEADRRAKRFKGFSAWLRASRATFVQDIWASIMLRCSEFVRTVTNGAISEVVRTQEDEFRYIENGISCSVEGSASGAQLCDIGLGLRFALADGVPNPLGFMFLDEPSAEMDSEHAAMLTGALRATGKQVIITSHREGDQAVSDSVICLS